MKEVGAVPDNGLRLVSTFSGCGGSCLGFRMAGFRTLWASEFIETARRVYEENHPGVPVDGRDIREIRPGEILEASGLKEGELDVLEGSPPCASFSTSGSLSEGWGRVRKYSETEQRVDDLFFEFARILRGLRPKVFVAENVSGLVKGRAKGYFLEITQELKSAGYRVRSKVLNAKWLGVPQDRARLIFIGVREDLGKPPGFPKPLPYFYSIRDAGIDCRAIIHDPRGHHPALVKSADEPAPVINTQDHQFWIVPSPEELLDVDLSKTAIGRDLEGIPPGGSSNRYLNLSRPHPDGPSPTVTATGGVLGAASVVHPDGRRKFTIPELRRVCGFPDDFFLEGTFQQQWERLGRAVPPPMMKAVAEKVREILLGPEGA